MGELARESTRAAARDVSFYASGGSSRSAYAFHVVAADGHLSACGIPILHDETEPAEDVPERVRCRRPGCRVRWPRG